MRWLLVLLLWSCPAWAQEDDEWGDVEVAVPTPAPQAAPAPKGIPALVGYFHAATVHMPIAWGILLLLAEAARQLLKRRELDQATLVLLLLTLASYLPGILSGWLRFDSMGVAEADAGPYLLHRNIIFVAFGTLLVAGALRWKRLDKAYLVLLSLQNAILAYGAHQGAENVYGPIPLP
jgi:hypothetical protein